MEREIKHSLADTEWWLYTTEGQSILDYIIDTSMLELQDDADRLAKLWVGINDMTTEAVELARKYGMDDNEARLNFLRVSGSFDDIHDPTRVNIWNKALEILRERENKRKGG